MEHTPDSASGLSFSAASAESVFDAPSDQGATAGVRQRIAASADNWRRNLLDLSKRNRLLNFKPTKVSTVTIVDEQPAEVFRHLVLEEKAMKFRAADAQLALSEPDHGEAGGQVSVEAVAEEEDESLHLEFVPYDRGTLDHRLIDDVLQTTAEPEALDRSLRRIDEQARSTLEEQGVNTLFLALGILQYRESLNSDEWWRAPLVLVPVELDRKSARAAFSVRAADDDAIVNPALVEYLRRDFGITVSALPDTASLGDDFDLQGFLSDVSESVRSQPGWSVKTDIYLGLFSFQKFIMYKDLEANRISLEQHRLIRQLITRSGTLFGTLPPDIRDMSLDEEYPPEKTFQVVDADSSQLRAIAAVARGHDLVLEGPPGTGKSQTITNLIAQALAAGQSVLFVAEKMAALEVVHRRLVDAGLGEFCLEMHSTKANKRGVMAAISAALDASLQTVATPTASTQRIPAVRFALSEYVQALHTPAYALSITPYVAYGELGAVHWAPKVSWAGSPQAVAKDQLDETLRVLADLTMVAAPLGAVSEHAFFGATKTLYTEADIDNISPLAWSIASAIGELRNLSEQVATEFGFTRIRRLSELTEMAQLATLLRSSPGAPFEVLLDASWNSPPASATRFVSEGRELRRSIARTEQLFTAAVFEQRHADDVAYIERKKTGLFGFLAFLDARYRTIKRRWTEYRRSFVGTVLEQAIELKRVDDIQQRRTQLREQESSARKLFGDLWKGEGSDWSALEQYTAWVVEYRAAALRFHLGEATAHVAANAHPAVDLIDQLVADGHTLSTQLGRLEQIVGWPEQFLQNRELHEVEHWLPKLAKDAVLAPQWAAFENARKKVSDSIAGGFVPLAVAGEVAFEQLGAAFRRAFYQAWLNCVVSERAPLREFHTLSHEQRVTEFRELDERVLRENRAVLVARLRDQIQSRLRDADAARCMPFLQRELAKQRGLAPLRTTMKNAEVPIRAIKPCFMMSPLTVAQLLRGDAPTFDLIVFDEASQLPAEDAVGAIIRGHRLVVVGDPKQLPPTNFFTVGSPGEEGPLGPDGLPLYTDAESVLEEYMGAGLPTSRLKWHYRSADESLITFSNVSFYDADLYTFPSVEVNSSSAGIHFEFVDGATYEGKGLNQAEARRVADAVVRFAKEQLERRVYGQEMLTLGVGTFNMRQQLAIQDELEQRRRDDPSIEGFFDRGLSEPFFVKNLENIQGDERDAIFISVTYAKGADGRLRYNFGPLNSQNGWRRLNVLVTRARRLMRVFSSMHGDEISPATTGSDGPRLLREFLIYAEHRRLESVTSGRLADAESPFERDVLQQLTRAGLNAVPQVGFAGYRIDIGILDEARQGRFLCGIECDGVAYHESETARDRDRLRQQVLEGRGWRIHRVWSTDWFKDRSGQIRRLLALIEADRLRAKDEAESERVARALSQAVHQADAGGPTAGVTRQSSQSISPYVRPISKPYELTPIGQRYAGSDLLCAPESDVAAAIILVIGRESPIHVKELQARVAAMWGTRAGRRIVDRIAYSCGNLEQAGSIERRGVFYWEPGATPTVRSWQGTNIPPERIAPEEYEAAVIAILSQGHGFTREQLLKETRSVLGYGRANDELKGAFDNALSALLSRGRIGEGSTGIKLRQGSV